MKIKIFAGDHESTVEDRANEWMAQKKPRIKFVAQSQSGTKIAITIIYK